MGGPIARLGGLVSRLFGGMLERRSVQFAPGFWEHFAGARAVSGVAVNHQTAMQCSTVLACVHAIASGIAMQPLDFQAKRQDGGRDDASDDPAWASLRDQPNEWQTWPEWVETTLMHAVLCGDAVSFVNRPNPRGPIRELIPLVPGSFVIEQGADYGLTYRVTLAGDRSMTLPRAQVFHLRSPSWNAYSGMPAVTLAREAIGLALATEESHSRLHANGTRPSGFLTTDAALKPEMVSLLKEQWQAMHGGLANVGKTPVLSGGLKWQQTSMSGVDAQHLETRRHQIEEICRAFGVFPPAIGHSDKASTFASAEQFFLAHVVFTLGRWTRRFEERLRIDLLTPAERKRGLYFKFNMRALLRGDAKARSEFYRAMIELGVMTRNEVRALEDLSPLDGLNDPLRPLNLATQAEADAQLASRAESVAAAAKAMLAAPEHKVGRVLSAANERRIVTARDELNTVLAAVQATDGDPGA